MQNRLINLQIRIRISLAIATVTSNSTSAKLPGNKKDPGGFRQQTMDSFGEIAFGLAVGVNYIGRSGTAGMSLC